ncbi:uncharacterized protein METZ01_LOCUS256581, partial [marine metagenome]
MLSFSCQFSLNKVYQQVKRLDDRRNLTYDQTMISEA